MEKVLLIILGFLGVHLFKMIRLYLVLMEHKISFWKFVLLYLRTTWVNLVIPFKLGELYRIEEVARLTGIWQVGVLSVVVDRFFDILALFIWLLPLDLLVGGSPSYCLPIFGILILLGILLYLSIPGSFGYLNRFLIKKKSSNRSMAALRGLGLVKGWYDFAARLVRGRAFLITFFSALGWGFEILTLTNLASYFGLPYSFRDFGAYIDSLFLARGRMDVESRYITLSIVVMAAATIAGYLITIPRRLEEAKRTAQKR
ncbi:MAG: flippase-like domain-containing protein [Lachnospiraceae bacterium]|nr:flippase-like domain-containing protein [Lachnospiraceae bacterium]